MKFTQKNIYLSQVIKQTVSYEKNIDKYTYIKNKNFQFANHAYMQLF